MKLVDKIRRKKFLVKDGEPLAVLRPRDPAMAIASAEALIGTSFDEAFQKILQQQDYQFVGFASRRLPTIVDGNGKAVGELRQGDSFVSSPALRPNCFGPALRVLQTETTHAFEGEF